MPPSSSCSTTCWSSAKAASKLAGTEAGCLRLGLNAVHRRGETAALQSDVELVTGVHGGGVAQDAAVGLDDGVAAGECRVGAECAQAALEIGDGTATLAELPIDRLGTTPLQLRHVVTKWSDVGHRSEE